MTIPTIFYACTLLSKPTEKWVAFRFSHSFVKARPCGIWEVYGAFPAGMLPEKQELGRVCSAKEYLYARDNDGQAEEARIFRSSRPWLPWRATLAIKAAMPDSEEGERYWCAPMRPIGERDLSLCSTMDGIDCNTHAIFKRPSGAHEIYVATSWGKIPPPFPRQRELTRDEFIKYTEIAPKSPFLGNYGTYVALCLDIPETDYEEDEYAESVTEARDIAYIRSLLEDLPPRCIITSPRSYCGSGVYWITNGNITHQGYAGDIGVENAFLELPPLTDTEEGATYSANSSDAFPTTDTELVGGATYSAHFRGAFPLHLLKGASFEMAEVDPSGELHTFNNGTTYKGSEIIAQPGERLYRTLRPGFFGLWMIHILAPPEVDRDALVGYLSESHWYHITPAGVTCSIANEKLLYEAGRKW
jgi:hypothetical protein